MPAAKLNLVIEEGVTWDPEFALWNTRTKEEDGTYTYSDPVDLTDYHVRLQWRKSLDAAATIVKLDSVGNGGGLSPDGTITIDAAEGSDVPNRIKPYVAASLIAALTPDHWTNDGGVLGGVWDMERYEKVGTGPGGAVKVRRIFKGSLKFDREVTQ